ncbi:MAG: glutamate ligase domain-containing protein [Patescibacteria group bacterium]
MKILYKIFSWYFRTLARIVLAIHHPQIVAITGSVGKTTTKDVVRSLVASSRSVRATIRSQNSELTTPLSILGIEVQNKELRILVWMGIIIRAFWQLLSFSYPRVLILELGAGAPGDISSQARWIKPHIAVFTALARYPVHLEYFDSKQQLYDEKKSLALYTREDGVIVYPSDDIILARVLGSFSDRSIAIASNEGSVRQLRFTPYGTEAQIHHRGKWLPMRIPGVWSRPIINSYRLGLEVVSILGLDAELAVDNFSRHYHPAPGRSRLLRGTRSSVIIDDSYNASPIAVQAALEMFKQVEAPARRIFLFGDMSELGEHTEETHIQVGKQASQIVDIFLTVGEEGKRACQAAQEAGMSNTQAVCFDTAREAGAYLKREIKHRDYILAKGSRHAIHMEQALEQIIDPRDRQYLVQEYLNK